MMVTLARRRLRTWSAGRNGPAALQLVQQRGHQARTGGAERMTQGDRTAVDIRPADRSPAPWPAMTTEAKASLISTRSISAMLMPAF